MGNFASKNTQLDVTSGAAHVDIQNSSVPTHATGTGSESSFTAANPETYNLGDMTVYGIPFASLLFTKSNTGTCDLTYGIAANGTLIFQISNTVGTIAITLSATTPNGEVFDGPLAYVTAAGAIQSTAIAADGVFYLYMGR